MGDSKTYTLTGGGPLQFYNRNEAHWPLVWRLPEQPDEAELSDKTIAMVDDLMTRTAINAWDNLMRYPGAELDIVTGMLSGLARFIHPLHGPGDPAASKELIGALELMIKRLNRVEEVGWDQALSEEES